MSNSVGAIKLTADAQRSPKAEITPADLKTQQPDQSEEDQEVIGELLGKFKRSSEARYIHELDWRVGIAFDRGNQWLAPLSAQNRLFRITDPEDPNRRFITANHIGRIVTDLETQLTATETDVDFTPWSQSPINIGATAEKRDVWAHVKTINGWRDLTQDLVDAACTTSTSGIEIGFDKNHDGYTWTRDAQGQLVIKEGQIGEIVLTCHPATEIYGDTDGRDPEKWRWLFIVEKVACEELQETYGLDGVVDADDGADSLAGYLDLRIDSITGDAIKNAAPDRHSAYLYRYYERPSPKFKKGRYVPFTSKRMMVPYAKCKALPFDWCWKEDRLPFEFWCYKKKFHTAWGMNAVQELVDLQAQYNNLLSRTNDMINAERVIIAASSDANVTTDSFHLKANCEVVEFDGMMPPAVTAFPPVTNDRFQMLSVLQTIMQDIAGVHNLLPPQVGTNPSGILIDLYNQIDVSSRAMAHHRLEAMTARVAHDVGLVARERYNEPRLTFLSKASSDQQALINAHDFSNIRAGGMVRVEEVAGSSIQKSPAARQQMILDMMRETGGLNPQSLPGLTLGLDLLNIDYSDDFNDKINAALKQAMQMQAAQAQAEAQAQQAPAQQALEAKAEHDAAAQQQDLIGKQQLEQTRGANAANLEQIKQSGQAQLLGSEQQFELITAEAERRSPQITGSITAKATPEEVVAMGQMMGLNSGTVESAKAANAPPPIQKSPITKAPPKGKTQ